MKQHQRLGNAGFGLVEILVAFTVLGIAATGLFLVASAATGGNTRAKDEAAGTSLAVAKLESLKNDAFAELASGADPGTLEADGTAGGMFERSWTVTNPGNVAGVPARDLRVTVTWSTGEIELATRVVQPNVIVAGFLPEFPTAAVRSWNQSQ